MFASSEAVFFGGLIAAFLAYRTRSPSGPGPAVLEVPRTVLFSLALFASSATLYLAKRRLCRDDQPGFRGWLVASVLLGAAFITGQGWSTPGACISCHAIAGTGGRRGPDLSTIGSALSRDELTWRILHGGGNMPAYGDILSPDELTALLDFLQTLQAEGAGGR